MIFNELPRHLSDEFGARAYRFATLTKQECHSVNGSKLVMLKGTPTLGFLIAGNPDFIPGPVGFPTDIRVRASLLIDGLCQMPTVVGLPGASVNLDVLRCLHQEMSRVSSEYDLPPADDVYLRTRVLGARVQEAVLSKGLVVRGLMKSNQPECLMVGGRRNGETLDLERWLEGLKKETYLMIHLDNEAVQRHEAIHVQFGAWFGKNKNDQGGELTVGFGIPHVRAMMKEGSWLRVNNTVNYQDILDKIVEGRMANYRERSLFSSYAASSPEEGRRLARMVEGFLPRIEQMHALAQAKWGWQAVTEYRCYLKHYSVPQMMDVDIAF